MKTRSFDNWKHKSGVFDSLNIRLLGFNTDYPVLSSFMKDIDFEIVTCNDYKSINENSLVSTFVEDYVLERFWNNPNKYIDIYKRAKYVMSPDFSLLKGMPIPMQIWNTYRNRLVGYVWQSNGINVIPTVSWSDEHSFDFCFNGILKNSVVAISNIGCRTEDDKLIFDLGFNEMIKMLEPSKIIFQCNKKNASSYKNSNIVFIDSYWERKRKQFKF